MSERNLELDAILRVVAEFPDGVPLGDLLAALADISLSRRTLQRRVQLLVRQGRLLARGQGRGRHYMLSPPEGGIEEIPAQLEAGLPRLGREAVEIRRQVTRSLGERLPVGYRGDLLDAYQPGVTAYLPRGTTLAVEIVSCSNSAEISVLPVGSRSRGSVQHASPDRSLQRA